MTVTIYDLSLCCCTASDCAYTTSAPATISATFASIAGTQGGSCDCTTINGHSFTLVKNGLNPCLYELTTSYGCLGTISLSISYEADGVHIGTGVGSDNFTGFLSLSPTYSPFQVVPITGWAGDCTAVGGTLTLAA